MRWVSVLASERANFIKEASLSHALIRHITLHAGRDIKFGDCVAVLYEEICRKGIGTLHSLPLTIVCEIHRRNLA